MPNAVDDCPSTDSSAAVDADGCSCDQLDGDDDGIDDCLDQCPETSANQNVNDTGCSCSQVQCDDDDACNGSETCQDGICLNGTPLDCDDGDLCTNDTCDSVSGCENVLIECLDGGSCIDGECVRFWELAIIVSPGGARGAPTLYEEGAVVEVFVAELTATCDDLCPPDTCTGRCISPPLGEDCPPPCMFQGWDDSVEADKRLDNPLIVPMDSDKIVTANFQTVECIDDSDCDDEQFCSGSETCNTTTGECESSGSPCATGQMCDEDQDCCPVWLPATCGACGDGAWVCLVIGSFLWFGLRFVSPGRPTRRRN